jgi:[acyl-carrier-protein] S-malonyltransferase
MRAFLFSGQGSQKEGMADECLALGSKAKYVYQAMSGASGYDIARFSAEDLQNTGKTQLAVIAYSLALWESIAESEKEGAVLAGFSLGEYTALGAAGVLPLDDLTQLIIDRGKAMEQASKAGVNPGMAAVLGLESEQIEEILADWSGPPVYAANYNSPTQTVISGEREAIESLTPRLRECGARRVLPIAVAGAFHSPYMEAAADELEAAARKLTFSVPRYPLYSNLDGNQLEADEDFDWPKYLRTTLISPVRFVDELRKLRARGITSYVECGPGKTLQGLVNQTLQNVDVISAHAFFTADKTAES